MAPSSTKVIRLNESSELDHYTSADGIFLFTPQFFNPDYVANDQNTYLEFLTKDDDVLLHISWRKNGTVNIDSREAGGKWERTETVHNALNKRRPTLIVYDHGAEGFQIVFDGTTVAFYKRSINPTAKVTNIRYGATPSGAKGALGDSITIALFESILDFSLQ